MDSDDDFGDFTSVPAGTSHTIIDAPGNLAAFEFPVVASGHDVGIISFDPFGFHMPTSDSKTSSAQVGQSGSLSAVMGPSSESQFASSIKPMESNSDDDWGDFVEHTALKGSGNSQAFDLFATDMDEQSAGPGLSPKPLANANVNGSLLNDSDWKGGFWVGASKEEAQNKEQKAGSFVFDDLAFSAERGKSCQKEHNVLLSPVEDGIGNNNEMGSQEISPLSEITLSGQKVEAHFRRSSLRDVTSSPIPLSLFGDSELETENSKTELVDPSKTLFQGYTRQKVVSTNISSSGSTDLSSLIANLYTEAQPLPDIKNHLDMNTVASNEIKDSKNMLEKDEDLDNGFSGYQNSTAKGNCNLEKSIFSLSLDTEHVPDRGSAEEGYIFKAAGSEIQSKEAGNLLLLDSISIADKCAYVEAWASILAVCASELELALDIWKQAQNAEVHLELLADLQGKTYFAAIGQVYVVALILAVTSNLYKPWLEVAKKGGDTIHADLKRCWAVWFETNLKDGVRLALTELEGSKPTSRVSWKGVELFATVALEAYLQAARASVQSICKISLLPLAPFNCTGLCSIEWCGSSYLLPVANLWANRVSQKPPSVSIST